ncbi:MAG: GNAT family N-acetyltransferase [Propionibacteriaceae bacterium]
MDPRYRYDELTAATAVDDPRRHAFFCALGMAFIGNDNTPEQSAKQSEYARADQARMRALYREGDQIPVATFTSVPQPVNVGHGRTVPGNLISDVTVRASHRRRGLLTELMQRDLTEAQQRGDVVAALTASEGTIYGRFGFGIASRLAKATIDCTRFRLRQSSVGECEYVMREQAHILQEQLTRQMLATDRGSMGRFAHCADSISGAYDWRTGSADRDTRAVAHYSDGVVDGLAFYKPTSSPEGDCLSVVEIQTVTASARLALWEFLASIDLVNTLTTRRFQLDDPLRWALTDFRAVKVTDIYDMIWLRILDPIRALEERGWDRPGSLVVRVDDPQGFAAGTFHIETDGDRAHVEATHAQPQAQLSAETLASLYFGEVSALVLADAGRIQGDAAAVERLFHTESAPYMAVGF